MKNTVGAFNNENLCRFSVWAPFRRSVDVILPGKASISMHSLHHGYWEAESDTVEVGDLYKFVLDGELERPDPASRAQPQGVHGYSQVVSTSFDWTDQNWKGLAMQQMVIYELHVGTFTDQGNFEGIIDKLDYLVDLGINTIELMPVAQFPGSRNWGYDGVYPFATQHSYGGALGLKKLVNTCHSRGVAVILDVIYNHMGPEGNYLNDFGPYFTDKYHTPWGKAINFDDAHADPVRQFFLQNALMWLDEFHIDGLRLDAIHAIKDLGARHFLLELSDEVKKLEEKRLRHMPLIGECDLNDNKFISSPGKGGYGLRGQWIDEFHHALHAYLTGEKGGYYSDFGDFEQLFKAFQDTYVYDGLYSEHRKKIFGNSALENTFDQFVVFSQNHDQVGNRMMGDRLTEHLSYEQLKLCGAAVLTAPYVPMLFMGEEYAERKPFQYFVSHGDPDLVEAVRKGRQSEFAYFQKEGLETPDPQSETTFAASRLSWDWHQPEQENMLALYKALIKMRKELPAMRVNSRKYSHFINQEPLLIMQRRSMDGQLIFIIFNFGHTDQEYTLDEKPDSDFSVLLNSADPQWLGPGSQITKTIKGSAIISLAPYSALILNKINERRHTV